MRKRPGYREAIRWIVDNDDTDDIAEAHWIPLISVALVADLFGKPDEQVRRDIIKELKREQP